MHAGVVAESSGICHLRFRGQAYQAHVGQLCQGLEARCHPVSQHRRHLLAAIRTPCRSGLQPRHRKPSDLRPQAEPRHESNRLASPNPQQDEEEKGLLAKLAPFALGLVVALLLGSGIFYRKDIRHFVDYFINTVDTLGPWGYAAYGALYVLLEIVAVPAIPLTMTAGVVFGTVPGTIVVSAASVAAATIGFLIARYAARDKVLELAQKNPQFKIIDRAIGKNGFKIVALLRLSPLLPLALSNYFYGLTSVDLPSYVLASWLGMLPGTIAYVTAGSYGRTVIDEGQGELALEWWQVAVAAAVTLGALLYMGKIAKSALDEAEAEAEAERA